MKRTEHPIRLARKAAGKSQEQVARDLDVALVTFGTWERGEASPSADNLLKLADYFGVHPRELLVATEQPAEARG